MPYFVQMEDFESIRDEWEQILPNCLTNTVFVTPLWQQIWWRHFGQDSQLHILSLRDDDGILGIAPLALSGDGVISFLGDTDLFDYHDFLVIKGKEAAFYDALCDHLMEMDWHTLDLRSLPQDSPTLRYLSTLAESKGLDVEVLEEDKAPIAYLPPTWDEYLAGLNKKNRHELRRKLRRLEAADNAHQYACNDPDNLTSDMQDFFTLMRASSPDKDEFMTPVREEFFIEVAHELVKRDQFKLYFLEVGGKRVASCICFDYANSYLLYNSGYDPNYSHLSVGLLNKALSIKDAIEEGRQSFNFLKGTERYKYNLGAVDNAVYNLEVTR